MNRKRFLLKFVIVGLTVFAVDQGAGRILANAYRSIRHGEQGRTNWTIDSCRAQTVVLGSSRAAHHYVSRMLGGKPGSACYNAGKDKQRLPYCLAVLKTLYARYTPATIILDLNPTAFISDENGLNELSILLPYYHSNPEIRSVVDQRSPFEFLKTQSLLYCYNSLPLKILFNSVSDHRDIGSSDGYVPLNIRKEPIPAVPPDLPATFPLNQQLEDCFMEIIHLTERHHSTLIVVVSPVYYKLPADLPTIVIAKEIAAMNDIRFLDFSREFSSGPGGQSAFLDLSHLNDSAAKIFSGRLAVAVGDTLPKPP